MQNIGQDILKDLPVPLPPRTEQVQIANHLHDAFVRCKAIEAKIKGVLEKLTEYRSALITNAVTGKIDVRDMPLPAGVGP
jgi:type I restriction enzyme S subunit